MKSIILCILLCVCAMLPADGVQPDGAGTPGDPYQIATLDNLLWLSTTDSVWSCHYIQTADIDATGTQTWNDGAGFCPIGTYQCPFTGVYHGADFTINGLYINRPNDNYTGMFGRMHNGTVNQLQLTDANIAGYDYVGAISGISDSVSFVFQCSIGGCVSCHAKGGGITGKLSGGSLVHNCQVAAGIAGTDGAIGGVVGTAHDYSDIESCSITGDVSGGAQGNGSGGVVGRAYDNTAIVACTSQGDVAGFECVGGIAGETHGATGIDDCLFTGCVTGTSRTGGLVGMLEGWIYSSHYDYGQVLVNGEPCVSAGAIPSQMYTDWLTNDHTLDPADYFTLGSAGMHYQVSTPEDVWNMLGFQVLPIDAMFVLTADIDLQGHPGLHIPYSQVDFDGAGHTISNVTIDRPQDDCIGFFGFLQNATVQDLHLEDVAICGRQRVGALLGYGNGNEVLCCSTSGSVQGGAATGGVVGLNMESTVNACMSTCNVGSTVSSGGIAGVNGQGGVLCNCYSLADVHSENCAGGVACYNSTSTAVIRNCYNAGSVQADVLAGGVVYDSYEPTVYDCFWDIETSGQATSDGGTGLTTAQMQQYDTYIAAGWDFLGETANGSDDLWGLNPDENGGYPFLAWQGYTHIPPGAPPGSGTPDDPFQIATLANLEWLGSTSSVWSCHFIQTADINAAETSTWSNGEGFLPIYDFTGVYDGQGHIIDSLYINRTGHHLGFFAKANGATLRNIGLTNVQILGDSQTGALVGSCDDDTLIRSCHVEGTVSGSMSVGGLIGAASETTVVHATSSALVIGTGSYTGGIAGVATMDSVIDSCSASGQVDGYHRGGGIAGYLNESSNVTHCQSAAEVTGHSSIGGIVGCADEGSYIAYCSATGEISGDDNVGGLLGSSMNNCYIHTCWATGCVDGENYVGGLVGCPNTSRVEWCWCTGDVTGDDKAGGFVGYCIDTIVKDSYCAGDVTANTESGGFSGNCYGSITLVENCYCTGSAPMGFNGILLSSAHVVCSYWNAQTSSATASQGGSGLTTDQMQQYDTYIAAGWDFLGETANGTDDFWGLNPAENGGYPFLAWQGYTHEPPIAPPGSGTPEDPYQIATLGALQWLSNSVGVWDCCFIQTADINAAGTVEWNDGEGFRPIGTDAVAFAGTYDGQGHAIDSLYINREDSYSGCWGKIGGAELRNIALTNVRINGMQSTGALAGYSSEQTLVESCYVSGSVSGSAEVGGLIGMAIRTFISQSRVDATVTSESSDCGGIAGVAVYNTEIDGCTTSGEVNAGWHGGGIVGQLHIFSQIIHSHSSSQVTGNDYIGGLAGNTSSSCYIAWCSATGIVEGSSNVGGFVGYSGQNDLQSNWCSGDVTGEEGVGGFIGYCISSSIGNSYCTGNVTADSVSGGFSGVCNGADGVIEHCYCTGSAPKGFNGYLVDSAQVLGCFWNMQTSSATTSQGGTGLTTAEMRLMSTYTAAGWDFLEETANGTDDDWGLNPDENGGYPFLAWQGYPHDPPEPTSGEVDAPLLTLLHGNRPNPFNPSTIIRLSIAAGERGELCIYNVRGQCVRRWAALPTGRHSIYWQGDDEHGAPVASGVYFARLRVGGKVHTSKMLLLK